MFLLTFFYYYYGFWSNTSRWVIVRKASRWTVHRFVATKGPQCLSDLLDDATHTHSQAPVSSPNQPSSITQTVAPSWSGWTRLDVWQVQTATGKLQAVNRTKWTKSILLSLSLSGFGSLVLWLCSCSFLFTLNLFFPSYAFFLLFIFFSDYTSPGIPGHVAVGKR